MTTQEFFQALAEARSLFTWALEPVAHEPERRSVSRLVITARMSSEDGPIRLDPLRALCYLRTGEILPPGAWSDAADVLDLRLPVAAVLVAAANDRVWSGLREHRAPADHLQSFRRRMLDTLGLSRSALAPPRY